MKHLDLFSGIGGFALAASEVWGDEYECVAFCDNDYFCQQVLTKNFPGVPIYGDIRELTADRLAADAESQQDRRIQQSKISSNARTGHQRIDLLTGGFPCQPFSNAGKKRGNQDDRYLWPEMLRVIRETKPAWVIGENVAGIIRMALDTVCVDLEGEGYSVQPFVIPAAAVGAPHRRDRVWIVGQLDNDADGQRQSGGSAKRKGIGNGIQATSDSTSGDARHATSDGQYGAKNSEGGTKGNDGNEAGSDEVRQPQRADPLRRLPERTEWNRNWREVALATCNDGMDDGLPKRMVRLSDGSAISEARWRREALKAYGNAIVPQVAAEVMKAIKNNKFW